jgi:hypothetical protein
MVNLYVSYSQPINAPGVAPTLGRRQVWAGLQRKVRDPTKFVPVITSCVVLEDKDNVVTREVHFVEGFTDAPQPVREVCKECYPTKVCHVDLPISVAAQLEISSSLAFVGIVLLIFTSTDRFHSAQRRGNPKPNIRWANWHIRRSVADIYIRALSAECGGLDKGGERSREEI